ncbi:LPXTG cell wall anchor domain-containing protein [Kitasatospora sp. NBC_00458]|uniref:LPXTG cell wall anchor domain-containing protein n=1 Tax=Kitasatospora sp. NBC_00458 TaxID=2903568 RepID=UPI002E196D9B
MSVRSSAHARLLAATTLVIAVGAAALVPATAHAQAPAVGTTPTAPAAAPATAPAPNAAKPLVATLEPNAGQAPLTRGGVGAALTMTVTNDSDQEQRFHPAVAVKPVGGDTKSWTWIELDAKAISAPDTWDIATWGNDGFAGAIVPKGGMASKPFTVPARTTYTWAVSFDVKASLPADVTALTVTLLNDEGDSTNSAPLTLPVAAPTGALHQDFADLQGTVSYRKPFETDLLLTNNGGPVEAAITPTLRFGDGSRKVPADLKLEVKQGGSWVTVPGTDNVWKLPPVTGGLGKGATHHYPLRLSLNGYTGEWNSLSETLSLLPDTDQGPVYTIIKASLTVDGTPVPSPQPSASTAQPSPGAPSTAPGAGATTAPSKATTPGTAPATAAATATAPTTAPGNQAVPAAHTSPSPTSTAAGTHLAATGAGNTGALLGTGGVLVLLGAGAVLYTKRRRTQARG